MWEQFMESSRPSYNDLINTTVTGALMGEIFYRLSSCFLDERITGTKRVLREAIAGIIDPSRFVERLLSGKINEVTKKEIYQTEPLQLSLYSGARNVHNGSGFKKGDLSAEFAFNFSYGDPLEKRSRKPYDYFKFRLSLNAGAGRKIVNNIMGYGVLTGKNIKGKNYGILYGLFQSYDYWDNSIDELGTLGLGGGMIHRINFSKHSDITSHIHLGLIPMAGLQAPLSDSVGERNYDYAGGLELMLGSSLNIGQIVNLSASLNVYSLHIYVGSAGNYLVTVIRPKIAVKLFGDIWLGFEFLRYGKESYLKDIPDIHVRDNEERLFIAISGGYFGIP